MKTHKILFLLFLTTGLLASCNDFLDEQPYSEIPKDEMWQNAKDAQAGVAEIYELFRNMLRKNYWYWGEFRSDNFSKGALSMSDQEIVMANSMSSNHRASLWTNTYKVINQANLAIKYLPGVDMASSTEKNDLLRQALTMRALAYFYVVRVWDDVPVYTEPVENASTTAYKGRTPATEVLNEVILSDLKRAETLILKSNKERKRISLYGVWAVMADVYMWLHEYSPADQTIEKMGEDPSFMALETTMEGWQRMLTTELNNKASDGNYQTDDYSTKELIFVIHYEMSEVGTNGYSYMYQWFTGSGNRAGVLSEAFLNKLDRNNDQRAPILAMEYQRATELNKFIGGVISTTLNRTCEIAYPVYRYADMILLRAEALAHHGKWDEALDLVRTVRTRAGVGESTRNVGSFSSTEELIDYILDERQVELVGEGRLWFDLVRTNTWRKVMEPINGMDDERKVLFQIHYSHLFENRNIEQNPGY
ncbi:MAG: RagB/SusD family nutrient uptake outer membrane protein [Bacteroides sp.]|nr:RagB/SusD family nutrient uptake outer membrane protein [Bacteroides sp.]